MNTILNKKKEDVKQRFIHEQHMLDHYIQSIHSTLIKRDDSTLFEMLDHDHYNTEQIIHGLEEEIRFLENKIEKDKQKYELALHQYDQQQRKLHTAIALNKRFQLFDQRKKELDNLQSQRVVFLRKEHRLVVAERASRIEPYEIQVKERRNERKKQEKFVEEAMKQKEAAAKKLALVKQEYIEAEQKEAYREKLKTTIQRYKEFLPTIKEMDRTRQRLTTLKTTIQQATDKLESMVKKIGIKEKEIEEYQAEIVQKEQKVSERSKKQGTMYQLREQYKVLEDYHKIKKEHQSLQRELKEKKKQYTVAEKQYKLAEAKWFQDQAAIMASHLKNGDACPVCGSNHHPNKAKPKTHEISKEQFDQAKQDLDKEQQEYFKILEHYRLCTDGLKEKAQEVSNYQIALEHVEQKLADIVEQGKKLKIELAQLDQMTKEIEQTKQTVQQIEADVKKLREERERLEINLSKDQQTYTSLDATLTERWRHIPEEIQELT